MLQHQHMERILLSIRYERAYKNIFKSKSYRFQVHVYWTNAQMFMCWKMTQLHIQGYETEYTPPKSSTAICWKTSHTIGLCRIFQLGNPAQPCAFDMSCNHDLSIIPGVVYQTCSVQVKKAANNISITEERDVHL